MDSCIATHTALIVLYLLGDRPEEIFLKSATSVCLRASYSVNRDRGWEGTQVAVVSHSG
jgi:hypothetical protein